MAEDEKIGVIEKIVAMITTYGIKKVISALIIFMLVIITSIVFINQKVIINKIVKEHNKEMQTATAKKLEFRIKEVNPRVDGILYKLLLKTKADRAFVIEMHNGTDNPTGLPFAFGDMTYEKLGNDSVQSVIYEYEKINLSTLPLATYLGRNKRFVGSIEDLSKIDSRLAKKMTINGCKYIGIYSIRGSDLEIGWVGVSYCSNRPKNAEDVNLIEGNLLDSSERLSILLDINNNIKE